MSRSTDDGDRVVLELRGLGVSVPGADLLDGVDLDARAGEVHVLLGPSGSGKSTLLRALIGIVPASAHVRSTRFVLRLPDDEHDLRDAGERRWRSVRGRHLGLVGQDPALMLPPLRRVAALARQSLLRSGSPAVRTAVDGLLSTAGFADPGQVRGRYCYELSGGMAQRLGLGLAISPRPEVLLADEPSTALDPLARARLVERIVALAREEGTAIVLSTHDVSVAASIADTVTVLDAGRVVESGPASQVLTRPASAVARALLATAEADRPAPIDGHRQAQDRPPALEVRDLRASYRHGGAVLTGLDLRVGDGEVVGVAGRSGAGKSTLLRCVVGLVQPEGGAVVVAGHQPSEVGWRRVRQDVQLVPQDPRASLNPWRTAEELVRDPLEAHGVGDRERRSARALELLDQVGLDGLGRRLPSELSTGQCQRVAIARALAVGPRLLVADEPVTGLDASVRADVLDLLRRMVVGEQMAALVISHDIETLERVCDRVAVLEEGRIVEEVPAAELRTAAAHPFTQELLAAQPIARTPAELVAQRRGGAGAAG